MGGYTGSTSQWLESKRAESRAQAGTPCVHMDPTLTWRHEPSTNHVVASNLSVDIPPAET